MLLLKQLLTFLETQFLLFSNITHEFLKIILLVIFIHLSENHSLDFNVFVNSQKGWNLFIVKVYHGLHIQGRKLEHASLSYVFLVGYLLWHLKLSSGRTKLRHHEIDPVTQLSTGLRFLSFKFVWETVLPTHDVRFVCQGLL